MTNLREMVLDIVSGVMCELCDGDPSESYNWRREADVVIGNFVKGGDKIEIIVDGQPTKMMVDLINDWQKLRSEKDSNFPVTGAPH